MDQDKIRKQVLSVRATGRTNMFDTNAVQVIANEMDFYELVVFIEEHRDMYAHLILTGEFEEIIPTACALRDTQRLT